MIGEIPLLPKLCLTKGKLKAKIKWIVQSYIILYETGKNRFKKEVAFLAEIKPFRALRYNLSKAGEIEKLTCPPYDIINEEQRKAYIDTNEYNVIRLELPKGENPYEEAKSCLNSWINEEILVTDSDEGIYIYEEEFKIPSEEQPKKLRGIVCLVKLEEFENGVVLPHEETLSKAKTDRLNLIKATQTNFSQIYSLYPDEKKVTKKRIDNLAQSCSPRYEFDDGSVIHRLWVVNDKVAIKAICEDFAGRKLYIADGHHRYETALNYRNYCRENNIYCPKSDYVMMYLADMADEGLVVFPTHRLIRDLAEFNAQAVIEACGEYFDIETGVKAGGVEKKLADLLESGKKAFGFYHGGEVAVLTLKDIEVMREIIPDKSDAYRFLDVSILHSLILEKLLGIDKENMANQINLTYTRSFDEAIGSVDSKDYQCAFILNSTAVSEIGEVAANNEKMPQKSTYFYPKMITGLVMNKLN